MKFVKLALVAGVVAGSAAAMAQETEGNWMVRARAISPTTEFFEQMPEAAVITDSAGRIRMALVAEAPECLEAAQRIATYTRSL